MNYKDVLNFPPVEEIERADISTIYSFTHYDGPETGLVIWDNKHWFVQRFEITDDRYWIISLSDEEQKYALWYGQEFSRLFHTGTSWNDDGSRRKIVYGVHSSLFGKLEQEKYSSWLRSNPTPTPSLHSEVVGYFHNWRRK